MPAVGKTSLIRRYTERRFKKDYIATIGASFFVKELELEGDKIEMLLFDLAGQDRFSFVRAQFFKGAVGGLGTFDLTRKHTIEGLSHWLPDFRSHCGEAPWVLLGNKSDLEDIIQVERKDITEDLTSKKLDAIAYYETSAKSGEQVNKAFETIATAALQYADIDRAEYTK